jgi:hypothetical protein
LPITRYRVSIDREDSCEVCYMSTSGVAQGEVLKTPQLGTNQSTRRVHHEVVRLQRPMARIGRVASGAPLRGTVSLGPRPICGAADLGSHVLAIHSQLEHCRQHWAPTRTSSMMGRNYHSNHVFMRTKEAKFLGGPTHKSVRLSKNPG